VAVVVVVRVMVRVHTLVFEAHCVGRWPCAAIHGFGSVRVGSKCFGGRDNAHPPGICRLLHASVYGTLRRHELGHGERLGYSCTAGGNKARQTAQVRDGSLRAASCRSMNGCWALDEDCN